LQGPRGRGSWRVDRRSPFAGMVNPFTPARAAQAPEDTPRHTAIAWAMRRGVKLADAAGFLGVSTATLERVYWRHHPDFQKSAVEAMERK